MREIDGGEVRMGLYISSESAERIASSVASDGSFFESRMNGSPSTCSSSRLITKNP